LARWVLHHQPAVAAFAVLTSIVSVLVGIPPDIDSNLINLLPEREPAVAAIRRLNDEGVGINFLTLSFGSEDPEALDAWLDDLVVELEARDDVVLAMHELEDDLARQVALLQFEADEVAELNHRLMGAMALGSAMNPVVAQQVLDMGPLAERMAEQSSLSVLGSQTGRERVLVSPTSSPADAMFVAPFMEGIEATIAAAEPEAHGIEVLWIGGAYRHTYEDLKGIETDLIYTSVGSAVLVLSAILLFFRSGIAVGIVFPPLLWANLVNLALVRVLIGPLNTFTSLGTAVLFGLGIDFAVHLVGRYREHRLQGMDLEDAIATAWARTGPPCTVAALTSAGGFLALSAAEFRGFAQLGLLLAVGLLVCLIGMLVFLPVLLARLDPDPEPLLGMRAQKTEPSRSTYRYAPAGLVVATLATLAAAAWSLPRLDFEYDLSALRRDGMAYAELTDLERDLARDAYSPVVASFPSRDAMVAGQQAVQEAIEDGTVKHLSAAVSAHNVFPDDQAERNVQLAKLVSLAERRELRYLPPPVAKHLIALRGLEIRELGPQDLPGPVRDLLAVDDPNEDRALLLPKGNMWDVREARTLAVELSQVLPGVEVAGEYLGISTMFLIALRDAPWVTLLALGVVALLALWDLRRPLLALSAVAVLLAGVAWAATALCVSGVKLTMVNLTGIPILLGIGVDVVIHLLHRLREEGPGGVRRALRTTGVAAGISAFTTILSFLALTLAGHRGVRSLGLLVVIGLAAVALIGLVLLPLGWSAAWRLSGRAPASEPTVSHV
jgi:predicted RND superfamily exporter protein